MLSYCQLQFADRYRRMQITQLANLLLQLTIVSFKYETQIRLQKSFGSIVPPLLANRTHSTQKPVKWQSGNKAIDNSLQLLRYIVVAILARTNVHTIIL